MAPTTINNAGLFTKGSMKEEGLLKREDKRRAVALEPCRPLYERRVKGIHRKGYRPLDGRHPHPRTI